MRTEDKIVTYGRRILNYFDPGEHSDTSAIKNFS